MEATSQQGEDWNGDIWKADVYPWKKTVPFPVEKSFLERFKHEPEMRYSSRNSYHRSHPCAFVHEESNANSEGYLFDSDLDFLSLVYSVR